MHLALRAIDAATIRALAPPEQLIAWMREAMIAASSGAVELPLRRKMDLPDGAGAIGMMPGFVAAAGSAGVKLVSLVPPERRRGSSHLGLMLLYDADGLVPVAILCGATITSLRTAAASALATDVLARPDAARLAILGTGEQAQAHLDALPLVRRFTDIRIWGRSPGSAERLIDAQPATAGVRIRACATVDEAIHDADVICTVTSAPTPILPGAIVPPGCHVNLVGSSMAQAREADGELVRRARFVVDYRPSAFEQAGELLEAMSRGIVDRGHIAAEIGEVLTGAAEGRQAADQITVYKSLGIAAQDIVTARRVHELAAARGLGSIVAL